VIVSMFPIGGTISSGWGGRPEKLLFGNKKRKGPPPDWPDFPISGGGGGGGSPGPIG